MKYVSLGRTGLLVSPICLGTMNFGPFTPEKDSFAIMDKALDSGINFFDTANVYGRHKGKGVTEDIIGRWLEQGGRREKLVLATKVFGAMDDGPNDRGLSAYHIRRACEESLRRLKTDHIDLYQMHHISPATPWEEVWQAMEQLVREGKVLYVGSSNFGGWHIAQAQGEAKPRHFMGLISEQSLYNLWQRSIELEVIPSCRAHGVAILPWSPLAGGLLCGVLKKVKEGRRTGEQVQKRLKKFRKQLEAYEALCERINLAPADVALAWLLHQKDVTSPIIGPRTMEQLEGNIGALDISLSDDVLNELDTIWPGPGGEAPKAYAW